VRRIAGIAAIVVGLELIALPFALSLFSRTESAGKLTDSVRPAMSKEFLVKVKGAFREVMTGVDELATKLMPAVAQRLGQTPEEFAASTAATYPAVAKGIQVRHAIIDRYTPFLNLLLKERSDFAAADSLPASWLPMTAGAWGSLAIGVALLIGGILVLTTQQAAAVFLILGIGFATFAFPLAASFPSKSSQSQDLVEALRTPLSRSELRHYVADLKLARLFIPELTKKFIPETAAKLGMSQDQVGQLIATESPALAKAAPDLPVFLGIANTLIGQKLTADVPYFQETKKIPLSTLPWLLIGPGAVVAIAAALALLQQRQRGGANPALSSSV
jgi:hypothetical protein